jgi:hypothetical protein
MDDAAGQVKSSFQNAYTFVVSGVIYEMMRQPGDAYIDYKKALEIFPDNGYLQRDVTRLAQTLGFTQEADEFKRRFQKGPLKGGKGKEETGELVVFFEEGFAPQKSEVKLTIPVPRVGIVPMAFPIYKTTSTRYPALSVLKGADVIGSTEPICRVDCLAVKALKERLPAIITRQTIRSVAKAAAAKEAENKMGAVGWLAVTLYNVVSENADLRSWLTLPAEAQFMKVTLPAGRQELTLQPEGGGPPATVSVDIKAGQKTILYVIRAGSRLYCRTLPSDQTSAQAAKGEP